MLSARLGGAVCQTGTPQLTKPISRKELSTGGFERCSALSPGCFREAQALWESSARTFAP
jgi:hypothetical protein